MLNVICFDKAIEYKYKTTDAGTGDESDNYSKIKLTIYNSGHNFTKKLSVELTGEMLWNYYSDNKLDSMDACLKWFLKHVDRKVLLDFLDNLFPDNKNRWDKYEGGIEDWWGFGSVFGYELGLVFTVVQGPEEKLILTISEH